MTDYLCPDVEHPELPCKFNHVCPSHRRHVQILWGCFGDRCPHFQRQLLDERYPGEPREDAA